METGYSFWEDSLQRPLGHGDAAGEGDISFSSLALPSLSGPGSIAVVSTIPSSVLE